MKKEFIIAVTQVDEEVNIMVIDPVTQETRSNIYSDEYHDSVIYNILTLDKVYSRDGIYSPSYSDSKISIIESEVRNIDELMDLINSAIL